MAVLAPHSCHPPTAAVYTSMVDGLRLVSLITVNAGIGAMEFAADVWMHIESEEPIE